MLYYGLMSVGLLMLFIPTVIANAQNSKLSREQYLTQIFIPQFIGTLLLFIGIMGAYKEVTEPIVWQILISVVAAGSIGYSITAIMLSMNIMRWQA